MSKDHRQGKYVAWVWLAWIVFVLTAIASGVLIHRTGALQASMGIMSRGLPPGSVTVIAVCVGQTIGALLLAGGFTIANGIYDATVADRTR